MRDIKGKQSNLINYGGGIYMIQEHLSAKVFFESLNKNTMHLVDEFYDRDILFRDPMVEIKNRQDMKNYYINMYKNVESVSWNFPDEIIDKNKTVLVWRMTLVAKNFNGNKPLHLDGTSVIKFGGKEGKAIYHRDYFDMGAFVYEGIPILGKMVRFVKNKLANH